MTVAGTTETGAPARVTEIVNIFVRDGKVIAVERGGEELLLVV